MKTYGAEEARAQLPELLERAHQGSSAVITKRGRPYAALVPFDRMPRRGARLLPLKGTGRGLWGARPGQAVAEMRDEWS